MFRDLSDLLELKQLPHLLILFLLIKAVAKLESTSRYNGNRSILIDHQNSFKLHKLDKGPNNFGYTNKDELMSFYRQMQVMRRLEIMADNLYKQKLIRGFLHLYNGQVI